MKKFLNVCNNILIDKILIHNFYFRQNKVKREDRKKKAYLAAFNFICNYIEKDVVGGTTVVKLDTIHNKFQGFLQAYYKDLYNPNYKVDTIRKKLGEKYGPKLQFWLPSGKGEVLYSSKLELSDVVKIVLQEDAE